MRSFIDFSKVRPQNPDLVWVKLHPENEIEKKILANNIDAVAIEGYYDAAIKHKLPGYALQEVVDRSQSPGAAQVRVKRVEQF